ncbi:hypothetical protein IRZ34_02205 [Rhodococcus rhodochrous]|nr:hypothetical protein [Rhodococcus rhodochrous]
MPWRDDVEDLPIGENSAVPMEVGGEITRRIRGAGADYELQPGLVQRCEIGRGQHSGADGDDHLGPVEVVTGLELPHDRHNRVSLGRIALVASGLGRETGAVHQQPNNDCGSTRRSFEYPTFPQLVLLFCLEVQVVTSYNNRLKPPVSAA